MTTDDVHPVFGLALATIRPPQKLAGGAQLAVHGELEDVTEQIGAWIGRYGMESRPSAYDGPFGHTPTKLWSLRRPPELVVDVTDAVALPGTRGYCVLVYPAGGAVPEIPVFVRMVRLELLGEPARWVATFELEGGD